MERCARLLSGIAVLLFVSGCGAATTAPVPPGDAASTLDSHAPMGGIFGVVPRLVHRFVDLSGETGADLENGRWSVDVPAGAIQGDARITIGVASTNSGECAMSVLPEGKNKFDVPATVTVDCRSLSDAQLTQSVLMEFDPVTRDWAEVPGSSVDLAHRTVSAVVDHLARYTVGPVGGKAGW